MTDRISGNRIQAHRGASAAAPENTLAAFRAAHRAGAGSIETDLTLLADGVFCVFHDLHLGRTTEGNQKITDLTSTMVKDIDAGSWRGEVFREERIPLLADALKFQKDTGMLINWEIKDQGNASMADLSEAVITQLGDADPALTLVSSFCLPLLETLHAKGFHHKMALIAEDTPETWQDIGRRLSLDGFHLDMDCLDPASVRAMQDNQFATRVYTVNDRADFTTCIDLGIDTIITDRPEDFITPQPA